MDVRCRIELFGSLRVFQDEQVHTRFRTHKAAWLLAYLALHLQQEHPREHLIDLFWPDMESKAGSDNLSTALSQLRRQLEPVGIPSHSIIVADRQQVRLNPETVRTDVSDFDRLIQETRHGNDLAAKAMLLKQAIGLYKGKVLPSCYEEWAIEEQRRCQIVYQESLHQLAACLEQSGRFAEALVSAQQATIADPYDESNYQTQMRLLVHLDRPAAAMQVYERMKTRFQQELSTLPDLTTRRIAEALFRAPRSLEPKRAVIVTNALPSSDRDKDNEDAFQPPARMGRTDRETASTSLLPSLPLQLTRFFGREEERDHIAQLLQMPGTRLVSILGSGGVGKTRLALEVASQVGPTFVNRVWFVSLAEIPDARLIPAALVHALHLPPEPSCDPLECVIAFLADSPCLLVLDNMEHLLYELSESRKNDNPELSGCLLWIQILLQRVPKLVCLVTSRQTLRLGGEIIYQLAPLALPSEDAFSSPEKLLGYESVALYVDRARAARPDFALTQHNAPSVAALCRHLDGLPLAIEMASAWVKTLPPHKMLERLESQLGLLVSRRRDLPPRHQSLRATIEWSYRLLPLELSAAFARLSVFQGGWTLEAAEYLCGAQALHALDALQEHSLIVAYSDQDHPRYRLLEPLREFAEEKLVEIGECEEAKFRHAQFFADFVQRAAANNYMRAHWYHEIEANIANIRAAFDWFLHHAASADQCLVMAISLQPFWHVRGYYREGRDYFDLALARSGANAPTAERASALHGAATMASRQADYVTATAYHQESLMIRSTLGDVCGVADSLVGLGSIALMRRELEEAWESFQQARTLYNCLDDRLGLSDVFNNLGNIETERGELAKSQWYYEESLALRRQLNDTQRVANTLSNLGSLLCQRGNYRVAVNYLTECLLLCGTLGNRRDSIYGLRGFAGLAAAQAEWEHAIRLYGAVEALREALGTLRSPAGETAHEQQMLALRTQAGEDLFASNWAIGHALSWEQAVRYALEKPGLNNMAE